MTALRFIVLDGWLARHVAAALQVHCRKLASNGVRPPRELVELAAACALRVSEGPGGPAFDVDEPGGHLGTVSPRCLTYAETARWLSVSERTVKRLVHDGTLPVIRIGSAPRVRADDVEAYLTGLTDDHHQRQEMTP